MEQLLGMITLVAIVILQGATKVTVWAAGCKPMYALVSSSSVIVEYQTSKQSDGEWSLQAEVSWIRPSSPSAFDGYAVQFNPVGSSKYGTCQITDDYVTTVDESIVFTDLKFGYQYEFAIHIAQLSTDTMSFMKRTKLSWSPDCYEETQDKHFCQNQDIATISKVLDAKIDCIINDNINLTAYITWSSPLQVNGNLTKFDVRYGDESTHQSTWVLCDAPVLHQHVTSSSHSCALNLEMGYNYSAMIVAYGVNVDGLLQSRPVTVNFSTTELSSGYMTYRNPSTSHDRCAPDSTTEAAYNHTTSNAISSTLRAHNQTLLWKSDILPEERARQQLFHTTFLVLGALVFVAIGHAIVVVICYIRRRHREDRVRAEIDKEVYMREVNCDDCEEVKKKMLAKEENGQVVGQVVNTTTHQEPRYVPLPRVEINEAKLTSV